MNNFSQTLHDGVTHPLTDQDQDFQSAERATTQENRIADGAPQTLPEALERIQQLQTQSETYVQQLQRMQADMENSKKQAEKEMHEKVKFALHRFVKELMTVVDTLERAADAPLPDQESPLVKSLHQGVQMTLGQMHKVLESFDVRKIEAHGQPFNPHFHQVIMSEPHESAAAGTVIQVMQNGYLLQGRLVRPAMVVTAASPQP